MLYMKYEFIPVTKLKTQDVACLSNLRQIKMNIHLQLEDSSQGLNWPEFVDWVFDDVVGHPEKGSICPAAPPLSFPDPLHPRIGSIRLGKRAPHGQLWHELLV